MNFKFSNLRIIKIIEFQFLLLIILFINIQNVYSSNKEILGYNFNFGYHSYDLSNLNRTLQYDSFPSLKDNSFMNGIGLNFNYIFYQDTSILSQRSEFIKNLYISLNYYHNIKISPLNHTVFNSNKGVSFDYNIVSFDFIFPIKIFDFLSIHPSFGLSYNWGSLTIADSMQYSSDFKDYISHPPVFNEFTLSRISYNLGFGFYINYFSQEEKQSNKNILHIDKIGLFAHYFSVFGNSLNNLDDSNNLQNAIGKPVPGLSTSFPRGFVLELRITYDKETIYK